MSMVKGMARNGRQVPLDLESRTQIVCYGIHNRILAL